jgi:beta-lactamase regulating signal transducer with metallopeptidase domain
MSKNNIGGAVALLFVILLSQSKIFNILIDTVLGRMVLIAFLLIISYLNKILGVVAVLIIVIMFNHSNIGYMEGFTSDASNNAVSTIKTDASNNVASTIKTDASNNHTSTATEGFDIIGKESNIKRGKQSNSIPVNDFMRESNSVAPYEGSSNLESFSAF